MGCDAPRTLKIAAKWSISSHHVAGPQRSTIADHRRCLFKHRSSAVSHLLPIEYSYFPAICITGMVLTKKYSSQISHGLLSNVYHKAANRLQIWSINCYDIHNRDQDFQYVGKCIPAHCMRFCCIAGTLGRPIACVRRRSMWQGLNINTPII